jgi:hypothetical protein
MFLRNAFEPSLLRERVWVRGVLVAALPRCVLCVSAVKVVFQGEIA